MIVNSLKMEMVLGEGPVWNAYRSSWLWFDIINKRLYEKFHDQGETQVHNFNYLVSSMAVINESALLIASQYSILIYDLDLKEIKSKYSLDLGKNMRTNDGGVGIDGRFWFSSMELTPSGLNGHIYSVDGELNIQKHISDIGIPNTMVWNHSLNLCFISDSYRGQTYTYKYEENRIIEGSRTLFLDMSEQLGVPDGGALDVNGNIWIAIWGGHMICCFNPRGELLEKIEVPVPQPSSCCFGGPERKHLFITTAREGMTTAQLEKYPLSGSVFMVELSVAGVEIPIFKLRK